MTIVAALDLVFNFSCDSENKSIAELFDACDPSLKTSVENRRDELLDELNADGEWKFNEWEVADYDTDWANPDDFSDLDEYGVYAENIENHGEAFHLRREDVGDIDSSDFSDSYEGCWRSAEEFCQSMLDNCYDVPDFLNGYIDMGKLCSDWMMDYSEYGGCEGVHIFRD